MGQGQLYIGIALFILFLIFDAVLYTFRTAIDNLNESEIDKKILDNASDFGDTLDIIVIITNIIAGSYILYTISKAASLKSGNIIIGIVMCIILIVFGVLIPKRIGRRNPAKKAKTLFGVVRVMMIVLFPLRMLVTGITYLILRLFRFNPKDDNDNVTEEEIITMVNEGQEQGVLEASEAEMITNIFELGDKNAGDIMTHRSSIVALDCHMTLEQLIQSQIDGNYSRFPVYDGDIDNIIGTIHIRDALILYRNISNRKKEIGTLQSLLRPPYFVPDTRDIDDLLKEMQAEKIHMGIVIDEYGQTTGVISMEDIIEEIVGNILDEYDEEEEVIEHNEDDTYVVDGLTELEDLSKLLGVNIESEDYDTLNGFLISKLDRIPKENETDEVSVLGFRFKILEVSGNVIRKVEISREPVNENGDNENGTDTTAV